MAWRSSKCVGRDGSVFCDHSFKNKFLTELAHNWSKLRLNGSKMLSEVPNNCRKLSLAAISCAISTVSPKPISKKTLKNKNNFEIT